MKHFFTLTLFFMGLFLTQAQFTVATHEGDPIVDGSVFSFSHLGEEGQLTFDVTNTGSETIEMKIELVSWNNADGSGTFLCLFGNCLPPGGVSPGGVYTGPDRYVSAGQTSTTDNHFYNTYEGDGVNYPIEYVFRLFEVDGSGNEIGDSITFTYQYDGTASIEDQAEVSFTLYPTVSSDIINIVVNENVKAQLINIYGQIVKEYSFNDGNHQINVSSLSKQMYFIKLLNKQGNESLARIIVK